MGFLFFSYFCSIDKVLYLYSQNQSHVKFGIINTKIQKNMKKQIQLSAMPILLFVVVAMLQACVSDGDETIVLEFGNVKEMIVGKWKVKDSGEILTFTNDGYYTDTSDGGTRKHTWRLDSDYRNGDPYYGGIYLDGTHYDIESLGNGYWQLVDDHSKRKLVLIRDDKESNDSGSGSGSQPDSGGKGKLVSQIKYYENGIYKGSIIFYYDKNNRVVSVDYGEGVEICGPNGFHVFYNISGSTMTLSSCPSGKSSNVVPGVDDGDGMGKGTLNSMGLLTEEYFENNESEIASGDYYICQYVHNSKGQCTALNIYKNQRDGYGDKYTYTWENDCIVHVTGNPGGAHYDNFYYTNIENKANIDLNYLYCDQMYSEDVFGLALCGYISTKQKYLLKDVDWTLDKDNYPVKAEFKENRDTDTFEIIYTK